MSPVARKSPSKFLLCCESKRCRHFACAIIFQQTRKGLFSIPPVTRELPSKFLLCCESKRCRHFACGIIFQRTRKGLFQKEKQGLLAFLWVKIIASLTHLYPRVRSSGRFYLFFFVFLSTDDFWQILISKTMAEPYELCNPCARPNFVSACVLWWLECQPVAFVSRVRSSARLF